MVMDKYIILDIDGTLFPHDFGVTHHDGSVDTEELASKPDDVQQKFKEQCEQLDLVETCLNGSYDMECVRTLQDISRMNHVSLIILSQRLAMCHDANAFLRCFESELGLAHHSTRHIPVHPSMYTGDSYFAEGKITPGLNFLRGLRHAKVLWCDDDFVEFPLIRQELEKMIAHELHPLENSVRVPDVHYHLGLRPETLSSFVHSS